MAEGNRILGDSVGKATLNTEKQKVIRAKPAKPTKSIHLLMSVQASCQQTTAKKLFTCLGYQDLL
jgi:hypothetical protein